MGALYFHNLEDSLTHLIANENFPSSDKLKEAKNNKKIKIVGADWLKECKKQNKFLEANSYLIAKEKSTPTPSLRSSTNQKTIKTLNFNQKMDDSTEVSDDSPKSTKKNSNHNKQIPSKLIAKENDDTNEISSVKDDSHFEENFKKKYLSKIDSTKNKINSSSSSKPIKSNSSFKKKMEIEDDSTEELENKSTVITLKNFNPIKFVNSEEFSSDSSEEIVEFSISKNSNKIPLLPNFLCGISVFFYRLDLLKPQLKKLIITYGGSTNNLLQPSTTHVVTDSLYFDEELKQFMKSNSHLHLINPEWIIDCVKNQKRENETNYLLK